MRPELDIVVYALNDGDSKTASAHARQVFDEAAREELHLALIEVPASLVAGFAPHMDVNSDTVTCLRSVLMKPEHRSWLDQIMGILEASARVTTTPR